VFNFCSQLFENRWLRLPGLDEVLNENDLDSIQLPQRQNISAIDHQY